MMSAVSWQAVGAMALTVLLFWSVPGRWRWTALSMMTVIALGIVAPLSAVFLLALTVTSYAVVQARLPATWLWTYGVAAFFAMLGLRELYGGWVLLGAAFYILRAIHFAIESMRSNAPPPRFSDYASYMLFLPTIVIGPVERYAWFDRERSRHRWNKDNFSAGLETILYGYAQIVLLANYAFELKMGEQIAALPEGMVREWLECIQYGSILYFNLSGYSDIAIGFALLLGIRIRANFQRPYLANNIVEFWRRWHISVTAWCRHYVNMPVVAATRSRGWAALAAMLVLGLWQEFSLRYVAWGAYHGLGIMLWLAWRQMLPAWFLVPKPIGLTLGWSLTMIFVTVSFAITKENSLNDTLATLGTMAGLEAKP